MTHSPSTLAGPATAGTIVLIGVVLSCLSVGTFQAAPSAHHDEWRRTAHGWERAAAWAKPASLSAKSNQPKRVSSSGFSGRFDTHPAALALVQLVGALTALAAFTPFSACVTAHRPHWKAVLARSFRASAFGS